MSTFKHSVSMIAAGAVAFAAVFAAHQLTAPLVTASLGEGSPHDSSSHADQDGDHDADPFDPVETPLEYAILGRWQAPTPANQDAFVEFTEYGLWFGTDGCNRAAGTWAVDADGSFHSQDAGAMTQIGCDNVPIPSAVWGATTASIGNGTGLLTLTDAEGEIFELEQTRVGSISLEGRWTLAPADGAGIAGDSDAGADESGGSAFLEFNADGSWEGSDGCNGAFGTWELGPAQGYGEDPFDENAPPLPGDIKVPEFSGMTEISCPDISPVNLPILLDSSDGFIFSDADRITLLDRGDSTDPEEWEFVNLQRAE